MNEFVLFQPKSHNFYQKYVNFLLADCFVTPMIFITFVKHEYVIKMIFLVISYNDVVRIEDKLLLSEVLLCMWDV